MASAPVKPIIYKDLDLKFLAHPVTGNIKVLTNTDAIKQSVINTVLLDAYETLYDSGNYTDTYATLFENFTPTTVDILKNRIKISIQNYEPRAELINIAVAEGYDQNSLNISIYFLPINALEPVEVNVFLARTR